MKNNKGQRVLVQIGSDFYDLRYAFSIEDHTGLKPILEDTTKEIRLLREMEE